MQPKTVTSRAVVYALLIGLSSLFLFPLSWLFVTSLKPVEQAMAMPPTIVPRAYTALVEGKRMEVTRDAPITEKSAVIIVNEGPLAGKRLLVASRDVDFATSKAKLTAFEDGARREKWYRCTVAHQAEPGWRRVFERSESKARTHELAWDVVPESAIEESIAPRWGNYTKALSTLGGHELEEIEGTIAARQTGISEDTHVGFATFLLNTALVCVLSVIGAVSSNAVVAYGLAKFKWRGQKAVFAITLATMMVPFAVQMVPLYGIFASLGWVGTLYPLWVPSFFGSAFNIFLMRQFFMTLPDELGEAARIDGCSEWGIFWRIILPLSKPVLAVVALFQFLHAWNDFLGPLLYLTRKHTFTLALALANYQSQSGGVQWQLLMAASAVLVVPIIVLFFFTQRTFVRGIATTGVKG